MGRLQYEESRKKRHSESYLKLAVIISCFSSFGCLPQDEGLRNGSCLGTTFSYLQRIQNLQAENSERLMLQMELGTYLDHNARKTPDAAPAIIVAIQSKLIDGAPSEKLSSAIWHNATTYPECFFAYLSHQQDDIRMSALREICFEAALDIDKVHSANSASFLSLILTAIKDGTIADPSQRLEKSLQKYMAKFSNTLPKPPDASPSPPPPKPGQDEAGRDGAGK